MYLWLDHARLTIRRHRVVVVLIVVHRAAIAKGPHPHARAPGPMLIGPLVCVDGVLDTLCPAGDVYPAQVVAPVCHGHVDGLVFVAVNDFGFA